MKDTLHGLMRQFSGRSLEIYSAWTLTLFGILLLLPGDTFSRGYYAHMKAVGNECLWGWTMIGAGVLQGLAISRCPAQAYWCRLMACMISCVIWSYISIPLIFRDPPAAGAAPYASLAVAMVIVMGRGRPT